MQYNESNHNLYSFFNSNNNDNNNENNLKYNHCHDMRICGSSYFVFVFRTYKTFQNHKKTKCNTKSSQKTHLLLVDLFYLCEMVVAFLTYGIIVANKKNKS